MRVNPVKQALKAGQAVIGSEISRLRTSDVARTYAAAGFDFVFIDMEHTCFSLETVADMIAAARAADIVPIVRVPQAEYAFVARVLDAGAQGIIAPRVNRPEEVEQLVSWMRYPPEGVRGFACNTAQTDGQAVDINEFIEAANRQTLVVVQIERREAVANLEEMLSIEGVDVACLGFMDLTVDLGIPGQLEHPSAVRAVQKLVDVALERGVAPGIITPDMATAAAWISRGMRFVSFATEEILLQRAASEAAARLRAIAKTQAGDEPRPKGTRAVQPGG
jgi:2-keto-3-deoxy-L-rhamnonate aldolase RhmA